jgi:hypothetical protein
MRRSDGKACAWIPAASRDVARQAIGSRFVKGNGRDSGSSMDEGEMNEGRGEASEHNSQWINRSDGDRKLGSELRHSKVGALV